MGGKEKMKSTDSVIVSWDFSRGKDVGVLIVGSQKNGQVWMSSMPIKERKHTSFIENLPFRRKERTSELSVRSIFNSASF